ncbi:LPD29 domain-containing protein [Xenorhabdus bovienii]|uniref:LPD29 domain-containing protein n=1 Tax=Xenorhabdus bovienii TaxID=40576 RepID=UPI003DA3BE17
MNTQFFKVGQCLKSELDIDYVVTGLTHIKGECNYRLFALDRPVSTILSHATILRSGWKPLDRIMSSEEISQRGNDIDKAKAEKEKTIAYLLKAPKFSKLETYKSGECKNMQALAGRNIRILLKQHFNGVTFSVRQSSYNSIDVCWNDGPMEERVDALIGHFQEGCFNDMPEPFNDVFGGIKYMSLNRDFSDELISDVITMLSHEYDDVITHEHTPDAYRRGELKTVHKDKFVNGLQDAIYQRAVQLDKYLK